MQEDCTSRPKIFYRNVAAKLGDWLKRVENAFHRALQNASRLGELNTDRDLRALARFLTASVHGIGIMARGGATEEALREVVEVALSKLG